MALIITLILLSVTLIMAVAFLALARRERGAVTTTTDTTIARLATEAALAAAQAQMAANIFATTNQGAYDYHVFVSTNFINTNGYVIGSQSPTNVNYDYRSDSQVLNGNDLIQNIANLWLLPRAPVYVFNPVKGSNDFRFYLDLNRNGYYDRSGWVQETNAAYLPTGATVFESGGDPEWIGVLERPDQPHGPNNHFLARYAFLAQPIGNSLDLNYIHNEAGLKNVDPFPGASGGQDSFFRNQGVGSWELNLASFLADLNTNIWGQVVGSGNSAPVGSDQYYQYNYSLLYQPNSGIAFFDARSLLSWRYNFNYNSLQTADSYFGNGPTYNGASVFPYANIDAYSDGPLQTTLDTNADVVPDNPNLSWSGSDNTNRFFSLVSDLYDSTKSSPAFYNRLWSAGISNSTYDRYTFYRLLDQMGTDSKVDDNKLNLNYSNAVVGCNAYGMVTNVSIVPGAETNLVPWTAMNFFNAAANSMLLYYSSNWLASDTSAGHFYYTNMFAGLTNAFGVTNIPVYVNGQFVYSPAVNRVLQLAANIFDASTNYPYPSVFRPIISRIGTNLFIVGYTNVPSVTSVSDPQLVTPVDPAYYSTYPGTQTLPVNLYGVPWIIGAKKGMPGFNQLAMVNSAYFVRRLEAVRKTATDLPFQTNQMVTLTLNNNLGVSFWNSYSNDYVGSGNLTVFAGSKTSIFLTNTILGPGNPYPFLFATNFSLSLNYWPGSKWGANDSGLPAQNSFISTTWTNNLVPGYAYNFATGGFVSTNGGTAPNANPWDPTLSPLPPMGLLTTNWLQAYILDGPVGNCHVIDYVHLRGPIDSTNLTTALSDPGSSTYKGGAPYYLWSTNTSGNGVSFGIGNQLTVSSLTVTPPASAKWTPVPGIPNGAQQVFFGAAFAKGHVYFYNNVQYNNNALTNQAPYTAVRTVFVPYLYQVNDPLVHYTVNDLNAGEGAIWANNNPLPNGTWLQDNGAVSETLPVIPNSVNQGIVAGGIYPNLSANSRYQPWGQPASPKVQTTAYDFSNPYNLTYKDPGVWGPDLWDFPTNKFPTVGWLGRVHRGTPWQTVYLKASDILNDTNLNPNSTSVGPKTWSQWTGNGFYFDSSNSAPVQDRGLFDLFTTRFNDNAVHGSLSVNQTHLAAWSALFGGLVVPTNLLGGYTVISPSGPAGEFTDPYLGALVAGINNTRSTFTNADGLVGVFERPGDILKTPVLTEKSPFLAGGVNDELYEWLPQQTLGLLHADTAPRYVVYCYGQTLKPAPNSLVTAAGQFFGLCTNYQITAENAARAVIRVDRHISVNNAGVPIGTNYTTVLESFNPLPPN